MGGGINMINNAYGDAPRGYFLDFCERSLSSLILHENHYWLREPKLPRVLYGVLVRPSSKKREKRLFFNFQVKILGLLSKTVNIRKIEVFSYTLLQNISP